MRQVPVMVWVVVAMAVGPVIGDGNAQTTAKAARAPDHTGNEEKSVHVPGTAIIHGTIVFQNDAARPWRLGRYYIKNAKTGELAEAIVALSRRGLKGKDATRDAETVTVDQKDFQFHPETIAIRTGDRVRFLNNDSQVHNVRTSSSWHSFNVNMPSGGEHVETFARAGGIRQPYQIGCVYHAAMRSWVFVFDHPWFDQTAGDGTFRLVNVPPGEYRLEVAHPAGELQASQPIVVMADQTLNVDFRLSPDDRHQQAK